MQIRLSVNKESHSRKFTFALETPDGDGVETQLSNHEAQLLSRALDHFIYSADIMGYFESGLEYTQEVS